MALTRLKLPQTCLADKCDYIAHMSKLILLVALIAALIVVAGCKSSSGSRDYIPGKGWVPND
jgi:hypothetical protein